MALLHKALKKFKPSEVAENVSALPSTAVEAGGSVLTVPPQSKETSPHQTDASDKVVITGEKAGPEPSPEGYSTQEITASTALGSGRIPATGGEAAHTGSVNDPPSPSQTGSLLADFAQHTSEEQEVIIGKRLGELATLIGVAVKQRRLVETNLRAEVARLTLELTQAAQAREADQRAAEDRLHRSEAVALGKLENLKMEKEGVQASLLSTREELEQLKVADLATKASLQEALAANATLQGSLAEVVRSLAAKEKSLSRTRLRLRGTVDRANKKLEQFKVAFYLLGRDSGANNTTPKYTPADLQPEEEEGDEESDEEETDDDMDAETTNGPSCGETGGISAETIPPVTSERVVNEEDHLAKGPQV